LKNFGHLVHSPGLWDELKTAWDRFLAHVPRGEHDLDVGPPLTHHLRQFGAAHSGHSDIGKEETNLRASLEQSQRMMPIIGVKNGEAESLEHADRCSARHGIVLDHEQRFTGHNSFDLLWLEAQDVRGVELIGRRRMVQKALKKAGPALRFSEHLDAAQGEAMFRQACAMGLEGIVSKKLTSRYKSGACKSWLKVKNPAYERR
jgi:hypothetical protein